MFTKVKDFEINEYNILNENKVFEKLDKDIKKKTYYNIDVYDKELHKS